MKGINFMLGDVHIYRAERWDRMRTHWRFSFTRYGVPWNGNFQLRIGPFIIARPTVFATPPRRSAREGAQ